MKVPIRIAVLISGSGRTLQNFIDRIAEGTLPARIDGVLSSHPGVKGLDRAAAAGLPTKVVDFRNYPDAKAFSAAVTEAVDAWSPELVVMAGFLRRWVFPTSYAGRVLNIHPALLPKYGGKGMWGHHVHEAVLAAGERESGCTVHVADHQYDRGPILLQKRVPVQAGDTPETLAERVFRAECEAYPEAIRAYAAEKAKAACGR